MMVGACGHKVGLRKEMKEMKIVKILISGILMLSFFQMLAH